MGGITSKTVPTVGNDKWLYNTLIETYGVVNITDGTRKASFNDICAVRCMDRVRMLALIGVKEG